MICNLGAALWLAVARDPTIEVALIVALPGMIGVLGTIVFGFLNRRDIRLAREDARADAKASLAKQAETHAVAEAVLKQTDGINSKLFQKNADLTKENVDQRVELDSTKTRADRSEAAADATELERTREK